MSRLVARRGLLIGNTYVTLGRWEIGRWTTARDVTGAPVGLAPRHAHPPDQGAGPVMTVDHVHMDAANRFVAAHHRHSGPVVGHLWSLGLWAGPLDLRGVVIVGRPVARALDDGHTVEVTRLATDGTRNACSMLYGAACRDAKRRGYQRVVTYTLATETGASLRAAGFAPVAHVRGRPWDTPSRRRTTARPTPDRTRWERRVS